MPEGQGLEKILRISGENLHKRTKDLHNQLKKCFVGEIESCKRAVLQVFRIVNVLF